MNYNSYTVMLAEIRAHRASRLIVANVLETFDASLTEWLFMGAIKKDSFVEGTTAKNIAQELDVTMPFVTRITKVLHSKKYITVTEKKSDKRTKYIKLTNHGEKLLEYSEPVIRKALKEWLSTIEDEHIRIYIEVILKVAYKLA